jgi:hypothetical protein
MDVIAHDIKWFSSIKKISIPSSLLGSYRDIFNEKYYSVFGLLAYFGGQMQITE